MNFSRVILTKHKSHCTSEVTGERSNPMFSESLVFDTTPEMLRYGPYECDSRLCDVL